MSIEKVFQYQATSHRKWYNEPEDRVDEPSRDNVSLNRLSTRLSYLEKKVSDLELEVKALKVGGSKK
jgi:hypothetical protein